MPFFYGQNNKPKRQSNRLNRHQNRKLCLFNMLLCLFKTVTLLFFGVVNLYDLGLRQFLIAHVDGSDHCLCQIQESLSHDGVYIHGSRLTGIAALADALHERNLCQQRSVHFLSQPLASFLSEDVVFILI